MIDTDYPTLARADRQFIKSLHSRQERELEKSFIVEGRKLCRELFSSFYRAEAIVLDASCNADDRKIADDFARRGVPVFSSGSREFASICDAKSPQGILAIAEFPNQKSNELSDKLIILDSVSDPGNLGAIIRTADWFGFRYILLSKGCADCYNPKVVRASMGSIFRCQIDKEIDLAAALPRDYPDFSLYGATLNSNLALKDCKPISPYGLVFGSESHGISPEALAIISHTFFIPGNGAESLNASVAAGIAMHHFSQI